jgi:aspartate racemase
MRLLGLIGGMSWESTTAYYQLLNRMARDRFGGQHSARLLLWSVDFGPMAAKQAAGDWSALERELIDAAKRLEGAGAEALLICANTMHRMADQVAAAVSIPLIHIVDATAASIRATGAVRPLLLATRFTMEHEFYRDRLSRNGVDAFIPDAEDRDLLHRIIYDELVRGIFSDASREAFLGIIENGRAHGADSVILGCTELGILTPPETLDLPAFDTTAIHVRAAMDYAIGD